ALSGEKTIIEFNMLNINSIKNKIIITFENIDIDALSNIVVFNLGCFEIFGKSTDQSEALREFFRKYGIVFKGDWRYNLKTISF
nr:hypothetical protein [bacterium]